MSSAYPKNPYPALATGDGECLCFGECRCCKVPHHKPALAADVEQALADVNKTLDRHQSELSAHRLLTTARRRVDTRRMEAQTKRIDELCTALESQSNSIHAIQDQIEGLQTTLWIHAGFGGRLAHLGIEVEGVKEDLRHHISGVQDACAAQSAQVVGVKRRVQVLEIVKV